MNCQCFKQTIFLPGFFSGHNWQCFDKFQKCHGAAATGSIYAHELIT